MDLKVFKFGGTSVKNTDAVRNVAKILNYYNNSKIMIIISAMGKTTNALEKLFSLYINGNSDKYIVFEEIKLFHSNILNDLVSKNNSIAYYDFNKYFDLLKSKISQPISKNSNQDYAEIVSYGELISTIIVYHFLNENNFNCLWEEAGDFIISNEKYIDASVNLNLSENNIKTKLKPKFDIADIIVSQGFIAKTETKKTSTLGREGSDYSAAIFAYGLDSESLTIWKDVPGLLNADPKYFKNTEKIDYISYNETIELAYYGASIIHPKTIQPLKQKNIPLNIKSFLEPNAIGTIVGLNNTSKLITSYILKDNQILISISSRNFDFIAEENLSYIFNKINHYGLKINLMQNSAISFSVCLDNVNENIKKLIEDLKNNFKIKYNENLNLITIRNYNQQIIDELIANKKIYLEQKNRTTIQLLVN